MRSTRIRVRSSLFLTLAIILLAASTAPAAEEETAILQFPFANPCILEELSAFGIPNWSGDEPHNGIDLVIPAGLASARIIAPAGGTITKIETTENPFSNPPGAIMVAVEIQVDREYTVNLGIEPDTADPTLKAAQEAAVAVTVGQVVAVGDHLADLLNADTGYAHLHLMLMRGFDMVCPYNYSSTHAQYAYDNLAGAPNSNVPDGRVCYGQVD